MPGAPPPDEAPPDPSSDNEKRASDLARIQERLRRAQARMETHAPVHLLELAARAEAALGPGTAVERAALMAALSAEHTHFFPGFGLYLPLPGGVAVGVRAAASTDVRVEVARVYGRLGPDEIREAEAAPSAEASQQIAAGVVRLVAEVLAQPVEAVVAMSLPACGESLVAAVAVAAVQAVATVRDAGPPLAREVRLQLSQQVAENYTRRAFGIGTCVAALDGVPPSLLAVDAQGRTSRPVEPLSRDEVAWGLIHVSRSEDGGGAFARDFFKLRTAQVQAASLLLRNSPLAVGPEPLQTLRDVEHRQLGEVLALLPQEQRPVVRHLLNEDRRVPRLLMALRRRDGQALGALLLISHASMRDEWGSSAAAVEFVQRQGTGAEGIYGMRMTGSGFGGCMLVVGRPYLLPTFLDTAAACYAEEYGAPLHTLVL